MTAILALALAVAPGCPEALAAADGESTPEALAGSASGIVGRLQPGGGPTMALAAEAEALAAAAHGPPDALRLAADRFRARLRRHCALAAAPAAAGAPTPSERSRLEEILARPEFERAREDPFGPSRWLYGVWRRLLELLGTAEAGQYAIGGRSLFFAAVVLALGAALIVSLRRRRAAARTASAPEGAASAWALAPPEEGDALAEAALGGGRAAEAVRHSFLALLASLERSGRVPRGRALTNQELAALLGTRLAPATLAPTVASGAGGELSSGFASLASAFDRVVYGRVPVAAEEARACLARSRALRDLLDGSGA